MTWRMLALAALIDATTMARAWPGTSAVEVRRRYEIPRSPELSRRLVRRRRPPAHRRLQPERRQHHLSRAHVLARGRRRCGRERRACVSGVVADAHQGACPGLL